MIVWRPHQVNVNTYVLDKTSWASECRYNNIFDIMISEMRRDIGYGRVMKYRYALCFDMLSYQWTWYTNMFEWPDLHVEPPHPC